jgi:carbon starvation protein
MSLLPIVLACGAVFFLAYRLYGSWLARAMKLDPDAPTPAQSMRDDTDYMPVEPKFLLGQHFSAIAAAGPIVGPILAGMMFGWGPALLWIVFGAILIGGVHDYMALVASVRHKARSIAEVVREHMSPRSYVLFLSFIWFALVYIIVAFTDVTAQSFVGTQTLESGQTVRGGGIASSSLIYLALPMVMGLLMRFGKLSLGVATLIFLPLVGLAVWGGQLIPLELGLEPSQAHKTWDILILAYCAVAAVIPMWLLLQPRGHLGGYFLYAALAAAGVGVLVANKSVEYPMFKGWETAKGETLFPILFITIACGACSGFHSLIASGTTSKQLRRETDAKLLGYGTMVMEGMVAIIALSCVMMLAADHQLFQSPKPNMIYANGIGQYLQPLGVPLALAIAFGLMAFTTFVFDTLDVCTRLGRYIVQELTGLKGKAGMWLGTLLTAGVPAYFVLQDPVVVGGKPQPAWQTYWGLFGASNQLLAALTLLGITVWLWRTKRAAWVWAVTGLPTVWMYGMSVWALVTIVRNSFSTVGMSSPVGWVGSILVALAGLMLVEAFLAFGRPKSEPEPILEAEAEAVPA